MYSGRTIRLNEKRLMDNKFIHTIPLKTFEQKYLKKVQRTGKRKREKKQNDLFAKEKTHSFLFLFPEGYVFFFKENRQ